MRIISAIDFHTRSIHIHQSEQRQLAFLSELLNERVSRAGGDVSVNGAHLVEVHAATFEAGQDASQDGGD
jgi:hypothetical protein